MPASVIIPTLRTSVKERLSIFETVQQDHNSSLSEQRVKALRDAKLVEKRRSSFLNELANTSGSSPEHGFSYLLGDASSNSRLSRSTSNPSNASSDEAPKPTFSDDGHLEELINSNSESLDMPLTSEPQNEEETLMQSPSSKQLSTPPQGSELRKVQSKE